MRDVSRMPRAGVEPAMLPCGADAFFLISCRIAALKALAVGWRLGVRSSLSVLPEVRRP